MGRSKLLVVLCSALSFAAVPGVGLAAAGPSSLGPSSGSCRLERIDVAQRALVECAITAGSDTAVVGGTIVDDSILDAGQQMSATPNASFEGPGVSRSWDSLVIREVVTVTPGERYTLTLYMQGDVAVSSGATDYDRSVVEGLTATAGRGFAMATGAETSDSIFIQLNAWSCGVEPTLGKVGPNEFEFQGTMWCEDYNGTLIYDGEVASRLRAADGITLLASSEKFECESIGVCVAGARYDSDDSFSLSAGVYYVLAQASFFLSPGEEVTRRWHEPCSPGFPGGLRQLPGGVCNAMAEQFPGCGPAGDGAVNGVRCSSQRGYFCDLVGPAGVECTEIVT